MHFHLTVLLLVNPCIIMLNGVNFPMKSLLYFAIENMQQLSISIWYESESSWVQVTFEACCDVIHIIWLNLAMLNARLISIHTLCLPLLEYLFQEPFIHTTWSLSWCWCAF